MKATWDNARDGDTSGKEQVKHTPGPWIARPVWLDKRLTEGQASIRANVTAGAECPAIANGYSAEETNANARLIAAAPDLLEACKALVEGFDAEKDATLFEMMGTHGADQEGKRIQARAAIQKAEGAL